jgi:hypothetical protein
MYISLNNKDVQLREKYKAQSKITEAYFDKMWRVLKEQASVKDDYKESFKDIYTEIIAGRYEKGDGSLMKFIKESNPNFDVSIYKNLIAEISIQREGFLSEQSTLIDIRREHSSFIKLTPNKWFISNTEELPEVKIIESSNTKKVFETGIDDTDIFSKK